MAKYIKKIKDKSKNYNLSVSANFSQKKLVKSIKKNIADLPLDNVTFTFDGEKVDNNKRPIIGTILIIIGALAILFGIYNLYNQPKVPQCILPESSIVEPQVTIITPKPINRNVSINILNATFTNNLAQNLKRYLNQNNFKNISIGNSRLKSNQTIIEYKPEYKTEALFIQENYQYLQKSQLVETTKLNPTFDISILLGKSTINK